MPRKQKSCDNATVISVSFPLSKLGMLDYLNEAGSKKYFGMSRSGLIIQSLEYFFGEDPKDIEDRILNLYKTKVLPLPKGVTTVRFDKILQAEHAIHGLKELTVLWQLEAAELARVLYAYVLRTV
jgi:hypothetical protein